MFVGSYFCTHCYKQQLRIIYFIKNLWRFLWFCFTTAVLSSLHLSTDYTIKSYKTTKSTAHNWILNILNMWQGNHSSKQAKLWNDIQKWSCKVIHRHPLEEWHRWCQQCLTPSILKGWSIHSIYSSMEKQEKTAVTHVSLLQQLYSYQ